MEMIVGLAGMFLILLAFSMNQTKLWRSDTVTYDVVNAIGSLLLIIYSIMLASIPFLILNAVWFTVSVIEIFKDKKN